MFLLQRIERHDILSNHESNCSSARKQLNSCFSSFVLSKKQLFLLREMMQLSRENEKKEEEDKFRTNPEVDILALRNAQKH